jgi:hypothetical protein
MERLRQSLESRGASGQRKTTAKKTKRAAHKKTSHAA